jgi:hypothetical protein
MTLPTLKGEVSSLDRKLLILRGFIPRQLCGGKKFTLKGGVLHPPLVNKKCKVGPLRTTDLYAFWVFGPQGSVRPGQSPAAPSHGSLHRLPALEMLRTSLSGPPNLSDCRTSGFHTAGTLCAIPS